VRVSKDEAPELANALAAAGGRAEGSAVAPGPCPRAESTSHSGEKREFPKGCRQKRPYTLHGTAFVWSNPDEVWEGKRR
jgi:hypothetical protein